MGKENTKKGRMRSFLKRKKENKSVLGDDGIQHPKELKKSHTPPTPVITEWENSVALTEKENQLRVGDDTENSKKQESDTYPLGISTHPNSCADDGTFTDGTFTDGTLTTRAPRTPRNMASTTTSTFRNMVYFEKPPKASDSAFYGPPRYDWIDIETSAVVKIQGAFRRHRVMSKLRQQGLSTAAIRNQARMRRARATTNTIGNPADFVNIFQCCGMDMGIANNAEEYMWATSEIRKAKYDKKIKEKEDYEEQLRKGFRWNKPMNNFVEGFEMIQ